MKSVSILIGLFFASVSLAQQVPNTFSAGSPAVADEVNANFADADGRINTNTSAINSTIAVITVEQPAVTRGDISAQMTCPVNTIPLSASCGCDVTDGNGNTVNNLGLLSICAATVDGAVAVCIPDWDTLDGVSPNAVPIVSANCMSAILVDGTQAFTSTSGSSMQSKASAPRTGKTTAEVIAELQPMVDAIRARTSEKK